MSATRKTLLIALAILAVGSILPLSQVLAATTTALLTPAYQSISIGESVPVVLRLEDVDDLYGYQVELSFDPALVEVVDADAGKAGVQVSLGSFLQPDFVPQNNADNTSGSIVCVVSQLAPTSAVSGSGTLLTVTFKGKANGLTNIVFADLKLAKSDGTAISATVQNGQIQVGSGAQTPTPTSSATSTPTSTATPTPTSTSTTPTPTSAAPTATPTCTPSPGGTVIYVVRTGDTMYSIARRYGTTVQAIAQLNNIANPRYIRVGQQLIIPRPGYATPVPTTAPYPTSYVVVRGDTLYSIARRYGTTVQAIALANNIANPSLIYAGQRLNIPGGGTTPTPPPYSRVHVVQPGETLYSIARHYGTTHWAIAVANHLVNPNIIYGGQRLVIP
jgi:LysM repeat protein